MYKRQIQRNPFVVGAYQIRGLARIRQDKFDGAVEDYKRIALNSQIAIRFRPLKIVQVDFCQRTEEDVYKRQDLGIVLLVFEC